MKKVVFLVFVIFLLTTGVYLYYSYFHKNVVGKIIIPDEPQEPPDISIFPNELNFGNVVASQNPIPSVEYLTITNNGDEDLIINNIYIPPSDYITTNSNSFTVSPSSSQSILFTFAPEQPGEYDNNIEIMSNDPDTPSLSVDYLGIGTNPVEPSLAILMNDFSSGMYYSMLTYIFPYSGVTPFETESRIIIMQEVEGGEFMYDSSINLDGWSIKILLNNEIFDIISLSYGQIIYNISMNFSYGNEGLLHIKFQLISPEGEIINETDEQVVFAAANPYDTKYYPDEDINIENGYLTLDGNRFFAVGVLVTPSWYNGVSEMVEAKMNFIWFYQAESPTLISHDWENLSANNIKIIFGSYNSIVPANYYPNILPLYTQEDIILGLVSDAEFGNLIGWSNRDEPGWVDISIDDVEEAYNTIRSYDPNRVIFMNFAPAHPTDNLQQYIDENRIYSQYADVISLDIYPIVDSCFDNPPVCVCSEGHPSWDPYCILDNPDISVIGDFVDLFKQQIIQDDDKPFWMNLQAHRAFGQQINPTYEQMRFMTYQSIIHGATGVYYYSPSTNPIVDEDLKTITQELSDLLNVLTTDYSYRAINTADGIEYLEIPYSNFLYIIAVNRRNEVVQKSFDIGSSNYPVTVISENRQLNTNPTGIFSDTFQPFDTHIYTNMPEEYTLTASPLAGVVPLTVSFNLGGDFPINSQFRWFLGDEIITNSLTSMSYIYTTSGNYNNFVQILQNGQIIGSSNIMSVVVNPQSKVIGN